MSVWQTPHAMTSTSTSPGPGSGMTTSATSTGSPFFREITPRTVWVMGYNLIAIDMDLRLHPRTDLLAAARSAHVRRDWHASYEAFMWASEDAPLGTDDLDALAVAAWQLGRGKESVRVAERVFTQLARTDPPSAAMKAVELGLAWLTRGDLNIAAGWKTRARRLLEGAPESPTHGYLAYLDALLAAMKHDNRALAGRVTALRDLCARFDVPALTALGLVA